MVRMGRLALVLAAWLALTAKEVQAQPWCWGGWYGPYWGERYGPPSEGRYGLSGIGPGPGSTVQGDILRGAGYYNLGTGIYNHETAIATAIDSQTAYRINQYMYLSQLDANRREYLHLNRRQQRTNDYGKSTYRRLKDTPTPADIERGDALNVILDQVAPRISCFALRRAAAPVRRELLADISFFHAPSAVTFSLGRLTAQDGWPIALRGEPFAAAGQNYQTAVAQAVAEAAAGTLSSQTVQAVRAAAEQLYTQLQQTPPADREEYREAETYLQTLLNLSRGLHQPTVEKILAEVTPTQQMTVGRLLSFMHTSHLRFGPALTPEQRAAYEELYPLFAAARDQIFKGAGVAATAPPPPALAERTGHR